MKSKIFLIIIFCSIITFAQSVIVVKSEKVNLNSIKAYRPIFSKNNSEIFFTKSNFRGLYKYNFETNQITGITDDLGAGYKPLIVDEENIIFRKIKFINGKKYKSAYSFNTKTKKLASILENERSLKIPTQHVSSPNLTLVKNGSPIVVKPEGFKLNKKVTNNKSVFVENNNLYSFENNFLRKINPLGEGVYVWESLSSKGDKVLFSFGNKGSYLCDMNGEILAHIEKAHYPRLSPNEKYISYMIDKDNGYEFTESDIYIYSIELGKSFKITNTQSIIELYPEWSPDGNKLVYENNRGELYITLLKFERGK